MEGVGISVQAIEDANRKLGLLLDMLQSARSSVSVSAEHMAAVLTELVRVGEWIREGLAHDAEGHMAEELERYRCHLEDLRMILPSVHAQLLTERSRLQGERAHLEATASWARTARGQNT